MQVSELPKAVNEAVMYHLIATLPYKPYLACEPFLVAIEQFMGRSRSIRLWDCYECEKQSRAFMFEGSCVKEWNGR